MDGGLGGSGRSRWGCEDGDLAGLWGWWEGDQSGERGVTMHGVDAGRGWWLELGCECGYRGDCQGGEKVERALGGVLCCECQQYRRRSDRNTVCVGEYRREEGRVREERAYAERKRLSR